MTAEDLLAKLEAYVDEYRNDPAFNPEPLWGENHDVVRLEGMIRLLSHAEDLLHEDRQR